MSNYLETKIREIPDGEFQKMVTELCHCINFGRDQYENQPLSYLLMTIDREKRKLTIQHSPIIGLLGKKVDSLPPDSVVYQVCCELARRNNRPIEYFDGKTVLTLVNQCQKRLCPKPIRAKRLTRSQRLHAFDTFLIDQRRKNGDL
jgi:hypothetical protein